VRVHLIVLSSVALVVGIAGVSVAQSQYSPNVPPQGTSAPMPGAGTGTGGSGTATPPSQGGGGGPHPLRPGPSAVPPLKTAPPLQSAPPLKPPVLPPIKSADPVPTLKPPVLPPIKSADPVPTFKPPVLPPIKSADPVPIKPPVLPPIKTADPPVLGGPKIPPINLPSKGTVTDFKVSGFATAAAKGQLEIKGTGACRMRADILDLAKPNAAQSPVFTKPFLPAVALPQTIADIGPLPNGTYRAYLIGYDDNLCPIQGPDKKAGGWYVDFKVGNGQPQNNNNNNNGNANNGGGAPPQGGGGGGNGAKPATGKITSLQVPGGSFAEDDPQKLQVSGQGGCGLDLNITNKSYGGSFDQTYPVPPVNLDAQPILYNGTNFATLAQGSYHAQVTGKNGCTGTAGIDFKVTEKQSTHKVKGQPTLSFDQKPKSGDAFSRTKDSNIWFKVVVPQSVKDEQYATCCEVEFDFQNAYGGWEALPSSPFQDSSFGLAVSQQAGVVPQSVSGFKQGTVWRVKMRAYKYKTEFEWSDWLQFKVDQN